MSVQTTVVYACRRNIAEALQIWNRGNVSLDYYLDYHDSTPHRPFTRSS